MYRYNPKTARHILITDLNHTAMFPPHIEIPELPCSTDPRARYLVFHYVQDSGDGCSEESKHPGTLSCGPCVHRLRAACIRARNCGSYCLGIDAVCINKGSTAALSKDCNILSRIYQYCVFSLIRLENFGPGVSWASELGTLRVRTVTPLLVILGVNLTVIHGEDWKTFIRLQIQYGAGASGQQPIRPGDSGLSSPWESCCQYFATPLSSKDFRNPVLLDSNTALGERTGSKSIHNVGQISRSHSTVESQARSTGQVEALVTYGLEAERKNEQAGEVCDSTLPDDLGALGAGLSIQSSDSMSAVDGDPLATDISTYPTLDVNHIFTEAVPVLIKSLIEKFRTQVSRKSAKRSIMSGESQGRKRLRLCRSEISMNERVYDSEDFGAILGQHAGGSTDFWPCPFYLRNKKNHRTCLTRYQLRNIEDVREHLILVHRRPNFCPICGCKFSMIADRDSHIRSRMCHNRNISASIFEGLTIRHIQELAQLAELPLSAESHWYEMWATVFPDAERPSSCRYFTTEELRVYALREFCSRHRYSIVEDYLESQGLHLHSFNYQSADLAALYNTVLNGAIDKLLEADGSV